MSLKKNILLVEMLVEKGFIDEGQLHKGLEENRKTGAFIGATLVKMGFVKGEELLPVLSEQLNIDYIVLKDIPEFGNPTLKVSSFYIKEGFHLTGAANIVSSVILNFRAYDTLGEATVLFTAVIGVLAVMRKKGRKKIGEEESRDGL